MEFIKFRKGHLLYDRNRYGSTGTETIKEKRNVLETGSRYLDDKTTEEG